MELTETYQRLPVLYCLTAFNRSLHLLVYALFNLAAAADAKGDIYAIGGVLVRTQILKISREIIATVFNTVEVYSPTTQSWSNAPPMPTARWGLAAETHKQGNIYAIGGTINQDLVSNSAGLNTVERYTPPVTIYTFIKN